MKGLAIALMQSLLAGCVLFQGAADAKGCGLEDFTGTYSIESIQEISFQMPGGVEIMAKEPLSIGRNFVQFNGVISKRPGFSISSVLAAVRDRDVDRSDSVRRYGIEIAGAHVCFLSFHLENGTDNNSWKFELGNGGRIYLTYNGRIFIYKRDPK